jgi:rubrerythrin
MGMGSDLSGFDVLDIAEKIERSGVRFYRKAAGLCDDAKMSKLFVDLAQWETRHVDVFRQMKKNLAEENWEHGGCAPLRIGAPYAQARAGLAIFGPQDDPARLFSGNETKADILRLALKKEQGAIAYFTALESCLSQAADKGTIRGVIQEEKQHVRILTQSLDQTV